MEGYIMKKLISLLVLLSVPIISLAPPHKPAATSLNDLIVSHLIDHYDTQCTAKSDWAYATVAHIQQLSPALRSNIDTFIDSNEITFLNIAVHHNNLSLTYLLLKNGANPNVQSSIGLIPLLLAIDNESIEMVQLLIDNGADVNMNCKTYETPLFYAIRKKNIAMIDLLLKNKADVNQKNTLGGSPLIFCIIQNTDTDILQLLLQYHADTTLSLPNDMLPLPLAAHNDNALFVQLLLEAGAVDTILERDALVKPGTKIKYTALSLAFHNNNEEMINMLIKRGSCIHTTFSLLINGLAANNETLQAFNNALAYVEKHKITIILPPPTHS